MNSLSNISPSLVTRTSYSNTSSERVLVIGPRRINVNAITTKVIEDINFLREQIHKAKKIKSPNSTILTTYQEMLASRESILEWLQALDSCEKAKNLVADVAAIK